MRVKMLESQNGEEKSPWDQTHFYTHPRHEHTHQQLPTTHFLSVPNTINSTGPRHSSTVALDTKCLPSPLQSSHLLHSTLLLCTSCASSGASLLSFTCERSILSFFLKESIFCHLSVRIIIAVLILVWWTNNNYCNWGLLCISFYMFF